MCQKETLLELRREVMEKEFSPDERPPEGGGFPCERPLVDFGRRRQRENHCAGEPHCQPGPLGKRL